MDTSVLIAALRSSTGASYRFLQQVEQRQFQLLLTPSLVLEYESVLKRHEQMKQHRLSYDRVDVILGLLVSLAMPIRIRLNYRSHLTDPEDEHVFAAALNGLAHALVTYNVSDFLPAALGFGIQVVRPADIIHAGRLI